MTLQDEEREHRLELWRELRAVDPDNVSAGTLRDLGVYGGAQGIWVDKARTATIAINGSGVTVSLLHTGRHYPDDISEDGLIYHYPRTSRPEVIDSYSAAHKSKKNTDYGPRTTPPILWQKL